MKYQLVVYVKSLGGGGVDTLLLPQTYKEYGTALKAKDALLKEAENRELYYIVGYNVVPAAIG